MGAMANGTRKGIVGEIRGWGDCAALVVWWHGKLDLWLEALQLSRSDNLNIRYD